jgi:hypothetical protein
MDVPEENKNILPVANFLREIMDFISFREEDVDKGVGA